jgi:hypothetical protein
VAKFNCPFSILLLKKKIKRRIVWNGYFELAVHCKSCDLGECSQRFPREHCPFESIIGVFVTPVEMPPTVNPVVPRRRAVQWKKRRGRCGPLLAPSSGDARKRPSGVLCTQRWTSCLGCTSRRLYEPLGEVQFYPVSKFRFDAIRPAVQYR